MKTPGPIFVLWASRLDESVATVFVTELRRVGLPVQVVGLHRQPVPGAFGLALAPDISLEDALPLAHQVRCLIVPGPWPRLQGFHHDPRLRALLEGVNGGGGQIVVGAPGASHTAGDWDLSPATLTFYPEGARLRSFVHNLAQHLLADSTGPFVSSDFEPAPGTLTSHSTSPSGGFPMLDVTLTDRPVTGPTAHDDLIRVAADSPPSAVAGAIAKQVRRKGWAEVQAIGAGAVNQMMKAAIVARHYLEIGRAHV